MAKNTSKALGSEKKFNWILWSVIGLVTIAVIVGAVFIVKAVVDGKDKDKDRITTFDSYDKLPYSYFLKDYVYIDPTVTTTTNSNTTTEEVIKLADEYYLFVYDATKSCDSYGCSSAFKEEVGYEKFLNEVKRILDAAVANGVQVYVADVSSEKYAGYEGAVIDASYNYTGMYENGKTDNDGTTPITVVGPALIKVEGEAANSKHNVTVYCSGVETIYRDLSIKLEKYEQSWKW